MKLRKLLHLLVVALLVSIMGQAGLTHLAPTVLSGNETRFIIQTKVFNPLMLAKLGRWLTQNQFDVAGSSWSKGQIEVVTNSAGIAFLKSKGLDGFIKKKTNPNLDESLRVDPRYLNPATIEAKLKAIAQAYPNLTRLEQIGTSIQGRPIWALLVSDTPLANDPRALNKPSIIFDGLHHAREVMTPEIVVDVAVTLLKGVETNLRARQFVDQWMFWLVPMLNVDGSNLVFTSDNMWRKNARGDAGRIYGVDINRNYTYRWNGCNGSSGSTGAQDYRGKSAGSEPETQALMKLADKVHPTASLSYHSYSEFILYSYGCHGEYPNEKELVLKIASELQALLPSDSGNQKYEPGTPWELLYDVDGDSMDNVYASHGALSYTFEINQDFQPDYAIRDATVAKHRAAWIYFINRMSQNLLTMTITDAKTGQGALAMIAFDTIAHTKGELPFRSNSAGNFFKVLDPGRYTITAKLADGRTGQITVNMDGKPQRVALNIQ